MNPPRIRSRSFQFDEPIEWKDKWGFDISLWTFDGEAQIGECGMFGPYETQELAIIASKGAAKLVCESMEKKAIGEVSGKYLDMKNGGVLRSWEDH